MIEDKATEKLKKRAQDLGLIVNASANEKHGTIESQTETTRKLPEAFKQAADKRMGNTKKDSTE
jgi:hypothetical protein